MLAEAEEASCDEAPAARARGAVEVRVLVPSDPLAVRAALGSVMQGMSYLKLSAEVRGTLELVLAEALNNVVEHAHGGTGDGAIEVRVAHDAARAASTLVCELLDDGAPIPGGAVPAPPQSAPDPLELPEGGFGWMLIRELARDVDYTRCDGRNRLRFRLDVAAEAHAA